MSISEELERLQVLRDRGTISEEEFIRAKHQVLDEATFPNAMQSFVEALGVADKGKVQLLPRRGPGLRRRDAEGDRPQNDHHGV